MHEQIRLEYLVVDELEKKGNCVSFSVKGIKERELVAALLQQNGPRGWKSKQAPAPKREENSALYAFSDGSKLSITRYEGNNLGVYWELTKQRKADELELLLREQVERLPQIKLVAPAMEHVLASYLWETGCVRVQTERHRLFHIDGNRSPIYISMSRLQLYPSFNSQFLAYAAARLHKEEFDYLAGGETGGISFASQLGMLIQKPSFIVRKKVPQFGVSALEGIRPHEIYGKKVVLVEDTIAHGITKEKFTDAIHAAGGNVAHCIVLFDREQGGKHALRQKGVELIALVSRTALLGVNMELKQYITQEQYKEINFYFKSPKAWHRERRLPYHG